jgi:hypothetical protein
MEALSIFKKNISFVPFSILSSIPFFCFLLLFELVRQTTGVATINFLKQPLGYIQLVSFDDWAPAPYYEPIRLSQFLSRNLIYLIYLVLLYLVPYYLGELFSTILTVHFASSIYTGENRDPISLKEMIKSSNKVRFKGPFITSLYVLFLSTTTLVGLFWIVANYCILYYGDSLTTFYYYYTGNYLYDVTIALLATAAFVVLMVKYLEWSVGWNMSLVISVVEEDLSGIEAFDLSAYYRKGSNKQQGWILMLVFFIWGFVLRLPCMFAGCSSETLAGIGFTALYSGFICMGSVFKWVAFFVYYSDCKKRVLEKKFDEEVGRKSPPELSTKT